IAIKSTRRQGKILIVASGLINSRINAMKVQSICRRPQSLKGNATVTSNACQRDARLPEALATLHIYAGTISLLVASSSHDARAFCPRGGFAVAFCFLVTVL